MLKRAIRGHQADSRPAGGVLQHTTGAHPSDHMWQERLADRPGIKQLLPVLMEPSWVTSPLTCNSAPPQSCCRFWYLCRLPLEESRVASALMREMIEMCDNWLRVDVSS